VKKEDQNRISRFSVLSARSSEIESQLEAKKEEKSYLEDAQTELELCDDDEMVR
jgi:chaperonin cofactor prefoldin